ncbi:MAG: discoidin domain-containing protein, partial [Verrucomicrobiales bacterium]|nr:discoidin domain-containing protein [Verrucomicrobiales bacterium]
MRNFLYCLLLTITFNLFAADPQLDSLLWEATASNHGGNASRAIDETLSSRWDTGTGQAAGQWFQVDLGEVCDVSRVEVDTTGSGGDYFRQYALTVSLDGKEWQPAASGKGELVTKITPPKPVTARYLRVTIPDGADLAGGFWSIHDFRVFGGAPFGKKELPRPAIKWRLIKPTLPTRDAVVAAYSITDFGVNPAKGEDITLPVRLATKLLARAGGGTLWLPAGRYRLSEPIKLDNNTTIRGDWAPPEKGKPIVGTIVELTANRGNPDGTPSIRLGDAGAVVGINFWWPEQDATKIVPYPAAVQQVGGKGMGLENITFVNAYRGFACEADGCALFFLRNIYGTVLETGIEIDGTSDIGRMEFIRLSPSYWSDSGLPKSPAANGPHAAWMLENGTGIAMRRNDWSYAWDVSLEGYKIGFYSLPSRERLGPKQTKPGHPNGTNGKFRISKCRTGIQIHDISGAGMLFYDLQITGAENGIVSEETFEHHAEFQNTIVSATQTAVKLSGSGQFFFTNSQLTGAVENDSGYIAFAGCKTSALDKA